jgi:hypothetical protein
MTKDDELTTPAPSRFSIRLPGFGADRVIGLGKVVERVTHRVGIEPCGGCKRRSRVLNKWVTFRGLNLGRRR